MDADEAELLHYSFTPQNLCKLNNYHCIINVLPNDIERGHCVWTVTSNTEYKCKVEQDFEI